MKLFRAKANRKIFCFIWAEFNHFNCQEDILYRPHLVSSPQGVFTVWEETPEVKTSSRGHQRQVFLFKECIVLCKLKRDTSMNSDTYTFRNKMKVRSVLDRGSTANKSVMIIPPSNCWPHLFHSQSTQLNDVEIKETLGGDEKSWGLWHEHRGSLRRYTLQGRSSLVKLSWLKDLKELKQRSSLPTNSKCPSGKEVNFFRFYFLSLCSLLEIATAAKGWHCVAVVSGGLKV